MSNCTIRQTENNFLRWTRVYGTFSIQDMQAAGGIPAGCNPADVSPIINLTATSGLTEVTLNWTNTSSSQTGLYVYRSTSSGFTPNAGNLLATLGNVETYSDTSATVGTLYYYVVVGFNDEGESTPSNEASGEIFDAFNIAADNASNDNAYIPQV